MKASLRKQRFLALAAALLVAAPLAAHAQIETIELPPSREQGLDMIVIDEDALPDEPEFVRSRPAFENIPLGAQSIESQTPAHQLFGDLRRQLSDYRRTWGGLPQVHVPLTGSSVGPLDPRLPILRFRLGLSPEQVSDAALRAKVGDYQRAHGLPVDGKAGSETLRSLNLGAAHFENLIKLNIERARRLPAGEKARKYILIDAGSAQLWMYEAGKPVDTMRVIVGNKDTQTPMMAAMLRYVSLNPYWNVPPDLTRTLVAKKVMSEGLQYLAERDYEILSDWTDEAQRIDPATIDWSAVAEGKLNVRVRRGPGPWNSMGQMKFMLPNDFGIYLHDVPDKAHFRDEDRWLSNGCVRLEDAQRLAKWIFGVLPKAQTSKPEEHVKLAQPIPVYITYLTVSPTSTASPFRPDPYERDAQLLARLDLSNVKMSQAEELPILAEALRNRRAPAAIASAAAPATQKPITLDEAVQIALAATAPDKAIRAKKDASPSKVAASKAGSLAGAAKSGPSRSSPNAKPVKSTTAARMASPSVNTKSAKPLVAPNVALASKSAKKLSSTPRKTTATTAGAAGAALSGKSAQPTARPR